MILPPEALLRGAAGALFLLIALIALRDARHSPIGRYGALLALCGIAYLVESAPALCNIQPLWLVPVRVLSVSAPGIFRLWAAARFDDTFVPDRRHWTPWLVLAAVALWAVLSDRPIAWRLAQLASIAIVVAAIWQALAGRAGDLVEGRRRFRVLLAVAAALFIVALNLLELLPHGAGRGVDSLVGAASLAALGFLAAALQLKAVEEPASADAAAAALVGPGAAAATVALEDTEAAVLLGRLERLMREDKIYREEGLGIADLAARLGLPEYRLRRLINQRLGHRNFSTFVNGYRLADAQASLADPSQLRVPILTIALDAGFQSIGPFNRAFKAQFGVTPSEFRRDRTAGAATQAAE